MKTTISQLHKKAIKEVNQTNWKLHLTKFAAKITRELVSTDIEKINTEYAANIKRANEFVAHTLQRRDVDAETFFFAVVYFLYMIDEEHTYMTRFKY